MAHRIVNQLFLFLFSAGIALAANPKIQGASVTGVHLEGDGTTKITILNLSEHTVTGWTLAITKHLSNGQTIYGEHGEDYGPPEDTGKGIRAGEVIEYTEPEQAGVQTVEAELLVVFYDDQTAEVKNARSFEDVLKVRRAEARGLQQAVEVFKNAATDPSPRERAAHDFDSLVRNADSNQADSGFLTSYANVAASAPKGQEREFIQGESKRLKQRADAFTRHATIRRLP